MSDGRCFVALSVFFLIYLCSTAEAKHIKKESHSSDGCKVNNKFYKVGEEWSPRGKCERHTCQTGGTVGAVTCPLVAFPEGSNCYVTEQDPSKGYSDCCGDIVCPSD